MAVTRSGNAITMTAASDSYSGIVGIVGMTFQGTGLTADDNLLVTDTDGSPLADYNVVAASDNADLWAGRELAFAQGVKIGASSIPNGGTFKLTIFLG